MPQLLLTIKDIETMIRERIEDDYGRDVRGISFDVVDATEAHSSFVKGVCVTFGDKTLRNKLTQ